MKFVENWITIGFRFVSNLFEFWKSFSPEFANSDIVQNKPRFSEQSINPNENPWKKLLDLDGFDPANAITDRYHNTK